MFVSYGTEWGGEPPTRWRGSFSALTSSLFTLHSSPLFIPPSAENREILVDSFSNIEAGENLSYNKL